MSKELTDLFKSSEISEAHKELAEIEEQLKNAEVVEPEVEAATDEASK